MSDRYELFLTCPKGLEGLLLEEATGLGLEEAREHTSAIRGMADMGLPTACVCGRVLPTVCCWCSSASR